MDIGATFDEPPRPRGWLDTLHGSSKNFGLRRGLLLLIIAALLPITVLSILQGMIRLETRRATVVKQLSENAEAVADSNQTILASTEILLKTTAMNPLVRAGGPGCAAVLNDIRAETPAYSNLLLFDRSGALRCAASALPGIYGVNDRAWWATVKTSNRILVSDAVWGKLSQRRVMTMVWPLHDAGGAFDGVMAARIDLEWLAERLRIRVAGGRTGVAIVSASGQVVMASRGLPRFDAAIPQGSIGRVRDGAGTSWSYTVVPLVRGGLGQNALFVVYADPDAAPFGFAWWQTVVDFALPVLAILLASLAIWIGAQRLVLRWLLALQRLALHFAGGDYRRRPVSFAEAPREIRSVAAALYRMSIAVDERDRRLRDSLESQRLLAREVHHRVKNNFQVVMSLLSLQSSRLSDENAKRAIDQSRRRIGALALVHRLLYETGELSSISSSALLGALCKQLQPVLRAGGTLELHCEFDDVPLDIDSAVPLTLWIVETVNNAFHHGFPAPRGGIVSVAFRADDGNAVLTVHDDGIGFDPENPPVGQPGGYGLRLIRAIAGQLGGTATVRSEITGGSEAVLRFPLRAPVGELAPEIG